MTLTIYAAGTGLVEFSTTGSREGYASTSDLLTAAWTFGQEKYGNPVIDGHAVGEQDVTELLNALPRCGSREARGVSDAPRIDCDQPAHANGRCTGHGGVS